ncbi:MAG: hypothetical protein JJ967_03730, partial [Muricauda sp.]|nr:hypothetical protein [Allomuricauda sp.]
MKFLKHIQVANLFFFILTGTVLGQESLRVLYTVQPNFDLDKMQHAEAKTMAGMAAEIMTDFEFQLLIDNDQSIFKQSKQLVRDDINPMMYELAAGFCSGNQ